MRLPLRAEKSRRALLAMAEERPDAVPEDGAADAGVDQADYVASIERVISTLP